MGKNMSVSVSYDHDSKLILSGLECGCLCEHKMPDQDIYVGSGLLGNIPRYIRARGLGSHCLLVADNITYGVAGSAVYDALTQSGFSVTSCIIRRDQDMEPDERACGEVLLSIQPETEFLVSVGSGSITDITRVNAMRTGLPFVCVGTAPSMDGYTSVVAPLLLRGVKIHRAGVCPDIIVCDLDVLSTAPLPMVLSGFGDVLGKYIANVDWLIGSIINDEPYCPLCGEIVMDAVNTLLDNVQEIKRKSKAGIKCLIQALLLSGITIMIIGHTRAVASVEHSIAHYWEMMQLLHGKRPPAHGTSVGVATRLVWPMYLRFAGEDLSKLGPETISRPMPSREERVAWMLRAFGQEAGSAIIRDNPTDFLSQEERERRVKRGLERIQDIRDAVSGLPPFSKIEDALHTLGFPLTAEEIGIDRELLNLSMRCAKDYRSRYTLFKLIDELGLQDVYFRDYPL